MAASLSFAAPINGLYETPDVLDGRWTLSADDASMDPVGDELNVASWNGGLGTQWELDGAIVDDDTLLNSMTISPGVVREVYLTTYDTSAATLTLKAGLWTEAGDGDYVVDLTSFTQYTTVFVRDGVIEKSIGQIYMEGDIQGFGGVYSLRFLNAVSSLEGASGSAPVGYPSYTGNDGGIYGTVSNVQLEIVPEPATMSLLAFGGLFALRRRRN